MGLAGVWVLGDGEGGGGLDRCEEEAVGLISSDFVQGGSRTQVV